MVAVMEPLEIEGLGHDLLTEWGRWMRDDSEGRQSWAVKPRVAMGYHGDPPERVRWVDKLIACHSLKFHDHWSVISRFYLSDLATWEIARGMRPRPWPEQRVRTIIVAVCGMVEREWQDRT